MLSDDLATSFLAPEDSEKESFSLPTPHAQESTKVQELRKTDAAGPPAEISYFETLRRSGETTEQLGWGRCAIWL